MQSLSELSGPPFYASHYGYEVQESKDPFVQLADQATEQFSLATAPGGFFVDLVPARESIPVN